MTKKKGLDAITKNTTDLWYKVLAKHGEHKYRLAVNGLDEVILCEGYTKEIAKGTRQVNKKLKELLAVCRKTLFSSEDRVDFMF